MVFVVRVRDPSGMHRLAFSNANASWAEFQQQVEDVTKLPVGSQLISRTPLHQPQYLEFKSSETLTKVGLQNGDIVYLGGHTPQTLAAAKATSNTANGTTAASSSSSSSTSSSSSSSAPATAAAAPAHQLTNRCNHGPRGACPHCLGVQPGEENKIKGKCTHGPGAVCLHCSTTVKAQSKELPTWLCNHPDTAFCSKCIPKESEEERLNPKPLHCDCDRSKGQECSRCLKSAPMIKVDKIPFARFLDEKRGMCKFKHAASMTCAMCLPPTLPSFVGKKDCDKGHRPWPEGVCLSCAPANATIREQPYRHCDSVSLYPAAIQSFYANWMRSGSTFQRAAILFGRYQDEPAETNNPGAIRAIVHALYEPPQENAKDFVRFLKDPHEKLIHTVSQRLGLEVVGWIVTTEERKGEKYGGPVFLSGLEVQQAARFQNRYKNPFGYSRFVTVVMEHGATVEPRAYQVSDLAVCLERDGVFAKAPDTNMLSTRVPGPNEMVPTVVYKDRPLLPGKEFLPDEMIVKVITTAPKDNSDLLFKHHDFPSLKDNPTEAILKVYLSKLQKEDYLSKLADFNLLCFLSAKNIVPEKTLNEITEAIKVQKPLAKETTGALDQVFLKYLI